MRTRAGLSILILWFFGIACSFWWFEYRHWRDFQEQTVHFSFTSLESLYGQLPGQAGQIKVVHFTDAGCPCIKYQEHHLERIEPILVDTAQLFLSREHELAAQIQIPAVPSVAIWDGKGEIAYYGPYSSGFICGVGTDFLSLVIEEIKSSRNPKINNTVGIGCYCDWRET